MPWEGRREQRLELWKSQPHLLSSILARSLWAQGLSPVVSTETITFIGKAHVFADVQRRATNLTPYSKNESILKDQNAFPIH